MMPYTALGAIVLYTGYKLCAPKVWKHIAHIGSEQLFVFTTTVLVTVSTDLLWGIAAGILAKLMLEMVMVARSRAGSARGSRPLGVIVSAGWVRRANCFATPSSRAWTAAAHTISISAGRWFASIRCICTGNCR